MTDLVDLKEIKLSELKRKNAAELLSLAEELEVETASALRKQELMFAILKNLAARNVEIIGEGVIEVLLDGFGFLRSADANYLAGPNDIYVSPSQIRKFALRTGDTVEGPIRGPKDGVATRARRMRRCLRSRFLLFQILPLTRNYLNSGQGRPTRY